VNVGAILTEATASLESAGVGTARLDALVLLEDELKRDRAWLLSHTEELVQDLSLKKLKKHLARRASHEPLSYIRRKTEFFGREFFVDKRVLEPRPESETMIELVKDIFARPHHYGNHRLPHAPILADIGTGSGALGITAGLEIPRLRVCGTDIDDKCLKVAEKNAKKHKLDISLHHGDLLRPIRGNVTAVLANLPYVPARYEINAAARHEPAVAIFGGGDGLELYRRMFGQLAESVTKPLFVLTESLPFQHQSLEDVASFAGYKLRTHQDFIQVFEKSY
jgi:release factor glutamine methyltransferase